MDNHFRQMLAPEGGNSVQSFIESSKFSGQKSGYVFKKGDKGLGYYSDSHYTIDTKEESIKKRKRDDEESLNKSNTIKGHKEGISIDKLLEEADVSALDLDASSLKQLLLNFEKKINRNQKLRMKYVDEPEKFMDSEIELNLEINNLYTIAASPELYPVLIQSGSFTSILGMIAHENTDISISTIGLLQELTDPDTVLEVEEASCLVDALLKGQGLELIIQNLSRLDESNEEDAQGVFNTMGI
eukprot:gene9997-20795_t